MGAGDVIAVYAAVVATAALAWQVFSWRHARQLRVEVSVKLAMFPMTDGRVEEGVTVDVTNRSSGTLRVTGVGLFTQDGSGRTMVQMEVPPGATLPGTVEPNDSKMTYFLQGALDQEGFVMTEPIQGFAILATGETVRSKSQALLTSETEPRPAKS